LIENQKFALLLMVILSLKDALCPGFQVPRNLCVGFASLL
jgi:hypothetical protein